MGKTCLKLDSSNLIIHALASILAELFELGKLIVFLELRLAGQVQSSAASGSRSERRIETVKYRAPNFQFTIVPKYWPEG